MLGDDRKIIHDLAYPRIIKARSEIARGLRMFKVPAFNFDAKDYTDIGTWRDCEITEPPLTLNVSGEALKVIDRNSLGTSENIEDLPCHTQAVKRCIKLVTFKCKRNGFD
ncbi:unnamed protein product [Hermetia illucens]|uniref:Uncharacterized protein n=1 Tax=Hermetia illucens TaxID=343691 RepID=A0A7R8YWX4_HERIL|nr:unnamed protein product [Hermetia illucens]